MSEEKNIEAILKELSKQLDDKYTRSRTIMFIDITILELEPNDISEMAGLFMFREQNAFIFPIVHEYGGRFERSLGYGHLVVFDKPEQAAQAALKIIREKELKSNKQVIVTLSIHHGDIIEETNDILGSPVNIVVRMAEGTNESAILVSKEFADQIRHLKDIKITSYKKTKIKGMKDSVGLYKIITKRKTITGENID